MLHKSYRGTDIESRGHKPASPPQIEWVNHASFITSINGLRVLSDPWLEGTAFKDGWSLISPTQFSYDDFAYITHLWISHQHPDHFAPTNLRKIPAEIRARLTILYKKTRDKLVVSWCRGCGFWNVVELELRKWLDLAPGVQIMCGTVDDDSWLATRTAWGTLLNVNDCILKDADLISSIRAAVGPVDVLFTQFSYANWVGNPEDGVLRKREAAEKLERIRLQDHILRPRIIVPFASYVYFCNDENFFLNDGMNEVGDVASFIERDLGKHAVVLYPGDRWEPGSEHQWERAAKRYAKDIEARLAKGPTHRPTPVSPEDFERQVRDFLYKLRQKNPLSRAFIREWATFFLTDSNRAYEVSIRGIRPSDVTAKTADIVTSSENVLYAFRTPWGGDTLHVSGRFISHVADGNLHFFNLMSKFHYYNRNLVDAEWFLKQFWDKVRGAGNRLRRFAKKMSKRSPTSEN